MTDFDEQLALFDQLLDEFTPEQLDDFLYASRKEDIQSKLNLGITTYYNCHAFPLSFFEQHGVINNLTTINLSEDSDWNLEVVRYLGTDEVEYDTLRIDDRSHLTTSTHLFYKEKFIELSGKQGKFFREESLNFDSTSKVKEIVSSLFSGAILSGSMCANDCETKAA